MIYPPPQDKEDLELLKPMCPVAFAHKYRLWTSHENIVFPSTQILLKTLISTGDIIQHIWTHCIDLSSVAPLYM